MSVTVNLRTTAAFATGLAVAVIGVVVFQSWRADAFPGEFDTTFRPITPCRLFDTRPGGDRVGPHAAFGVEDEKTIVAHGTNGKCTIPAEAVGLQMNLTALDATATSFVTVWPGGTRPKASSLNPAIGQPPTPNAVSTNLTVAGTFKVYNDQGNVNIFADVTGYYLASSLNEIVDRLEALEASRPLAATARTDGEQIGTTPGTVVTVSVTPAVTGHVIVNSTATANEGTANDLVQCSISVGSALDSDHLQQWESAGQDGSFGVMAGTRMFAVAAGVPSAFNLVCRRVGGGGGGNATSLLTDAVLTAVFTPEA